LIALRCERDDPAGLAVAEEADALRIDPGQVSEKVGLSLRVTGEQVDCARGRGLTGVTPSRLSGPALVVGKHCEALELEVGREDVELVACPGSGAVNHRDGRKRACSGR